MTASSVNPIQHFIELFERARQMCTDDPTAMVLSTVGPDGRPSSRFMLLKNADERGFVFYTNLESRKAQDLKTRPLASLCIYWPPLGKQVRVEGIAELVADAEADAYFATRPREYQLGAWASQQSSRLESRDELERRFNEWAQKFEGKSVPRPPRWSGYRVVPSRIEFWTYQPDRLHERILYERADNGWTVSLLFP